MTRRTALALIAFALATQGASSCANTTVSTPSSPGESGSGSGAQGAPKTARVGDTLTLQGTHNTMKVTVLRVFPTSGGQIDTPAAGTHYVGVQLRIRNVGSQTYSDAPSNGAHIISSTDEQANSTILGGGECSGGISSSVSIAPGGARAGCIPFEVKNDQRAKQFQLGLDSGFGPQTGQWTLR